MLGLVQAVGGCNAVDGIAHTASVSGTPHTAPQTAPHTGAPRLAGSIGPSRLSRFCRQGIEASRGCFVGQACPYGVAGSFEVVAVGVKMEVPVRGEQSGDVSLFREAEGMWAR